MKVTANGHAAPVTLTPLRLPARGDVAGWPRETPPDGAEQLRTPPDKRERWKRPDGDMAIRVLAAIVVLAVAAFAAMTARMVTL